VEKRLQTGAFAVTIAIAAVLTTASGHEARTEPVVRNSSPNPVRRALGSLRRGRPRKFRGPSRPITLTLPEDTIAALQAIDRDISRAVVRAIQPLAQGPQPSPAEVATYGDHAVIIVSDSRDLRERTGVELVPLADGRALICFDERLSISEFELRVRDALSDQTLEGNDRAVFETLANILKTARRDDDVAVQLRSIIVLQRKKRSAVPALASDDAEMLPQAVGEMSEKV
jgi:hypothetical protein